MADIDRRLLAALTTLMPPSRRAFGQALTAELGLVIAVIGMASFAVIDNAFLSVVSHQQAKLAGFRASGMTSMRAYVNASLAATAPGVTLLLTVAGALLASLASAFTPPPAANGAPPRPIP